MSSLRILPRLMTACVAAALLAGSPVARAAETKIKINATELEPAPNPALAYNRMADAMGLFAKHGLELQLGPDLAGGGPTRVQAVATGATEVAVGDIIAVLGSIYSGAKVKVLLVMTPYGDEQIWASKKIATMKDAVGQSWAVASLAGAQRFNDQMAVQGMGLPADSFKWVSIPGGDGGRLQALITGRTQLASLSELGAALAKSKGFAKDIHALVEHTAKYTPPIPRLVVVAQTDWIKSHPDAAVRYVKTMLDAGRQWQNSAESWVTPAEKIYKNSGLSAQDLNEVWKGLRDGGLFTRNGGVNFAATQKVIDAFFKMRNESPNQYLSKPEDLYDTDPLSKALSEMGVYKGNSDLPDTPDWYNASKAAR